VNTIYFDHNATTPVAPEVTAAMCEVLEGAWHNPSARYPRAKQMALRIEQARAQVAGLAGVSPGQVIFTSGGTESIATAFHSAEQDCFAKKTAAPRVATSTVEHSAVKACAQGLADRGWQSLAIPVDSAGHFNRPHLSTLLGEGPCFVSLQVVNNETGVISHLEGISEEVHRAGGLFHLDGVQAPGKIPVDAQGWGADYLSLAAHKFGGPKGIGALILGANAPFAPLMAGGGQEEGRRAGTLNTASIIGMGVAAELAGARGTQKPGDNPMPARQQRLETALLAGIEGAWVNCTETSRVSATTSLTVPGLEAHLVLAYLDTLGIEASAGSACSATRVAPSPVLLAMGRSEAEASSTLRLSQGPSTTDEEIERVIAGVIEATSTLRALS
jgi:cysteine desulfurase